MISPDPTFFWDSDKKLAIVGGVYLGLGTLIGSAVFKIVLRSAQCWVAPWAPIFLGGLVGAAAAWGAGFAYMKSDTDNRFGSNADRVAHRDALCAILGQVFLTRGADHWHEVLNKAGVPAGPINDLAEAFSYAERLGLGPVVPVPGTSTPQVANPVALSATPVTYRLAPPELAKEDAS